MDREKAEKILEAYGKPVFFNLNKVITFARQGKDNIKEIEDLSDEQLIKEWKGLVFVNEILGHVSLNEMQRINLFELEIDERKIDTKKLKEWYEEAKDDFEKNPDKYL